MSFPDRLRLPITFDPVPILAEIAALGDAAWEPHFNTGYYTGDWSGVAFRSRGGRLSLLPGPPMRDRPEQPFEDTAHLRSSPALRALLARLGCATTSVRVLRLGPGAAIREHRDYDIGFECGEVRLHAPLESSERVEFVLAGTALPMAAGEVWYVDVTAPHRVTNAGETPRLHVVIDCLVDEALRELLRAAQPLSPFERFAAIVRGDDALANELYAIERDEEFDARVRARAAERGIALGLEDIAAASAAGMSRWHRALEG